MTSETVITETGVFQRKYWRKGKKKRQKTQRLRKNPLKVVLGKIGDLEVYVYPYQFPDKIFLGHYPDFTMVLGKEDLGKIWGMLNKMRWYLNGEWSTKERKRYGISEVIRTKQAKRARVAMVRAYNLGLSRQKKAKSPSLKHNYNYKSKRNTENTKNVDRKKRKNQK